MTPEKHEHPLLHVAVAAMSAVGAHSCVIFIFRILAEPPTHWSGVWIAAFGFGAFVCAMAALVNACMALASIRARRRKPA